MSLFSEQIEYRAIQDARIEERADEALNENLSFSVSEGDGAREALAYLLGWMDVDGQIPLGCTEVDELLEYTLSPLGVMYGEVDMHADDWRKSTEYLLAQLEDGTYVACKPGLFGYLYVLPRTGQLGHLGRRMALAQRGWAIYRPLTRDASTKMGFARMVFGMVSARDVTSIVAASFVVYLLGLVGPAINQWVLKVIVPQGQAEGATGSANALGAYQLLLMALVAYLTAKLMRTVIQTTKTFLLGKMRLRIAGQVEAAVMARTLMLPQSFFADTSSGKVSKRISAARQISDRMINFALNSGLTAVFSLGYISQMMDYGPLLVLPSLVALIAQSAFSVVVAYVNMYIESRSMEADLESSSFLYSVLKGAQKIRAMGAERRVYARWAGIYQRVLKLDLDQPTVLKLESEIGSFISSVGTLFLVSIVVGTCMSRADYIAFNSSYSLVTAAVGELFDSFRSILLMGPLMNMLRTILEAPTEAQQDDSVVRRLRGRIELDHVSFAYAGGLGAINDLSLRVRSGEKIAIVGESGCGKSTLMKLILGAETPTAGAVYVDGRDITSLDIRSYRQHIGSVLQFSKLIPGTVRDNICFTPRSVSEEEAWEAAAKAAMDEYLRSMPLGLDTEVSESNSSSFSGGQRQRILIARAFASKPDIMILDEATSALDNATQRKVLDAVYAEKCTVLMVAHRLSTVMGCDRILAMEGGRIVEDGTYEELVAAGGLFSRLVNKQIL